jgi:hypothetical protein
MSKKELIVAELDKLSEESLDRLYGVVQSLARREAGAKDGRGLLERLQEIQLDGPEDFSVNLDHYLYGHPRTEAGG